jgi:hypothetical protein
MCVPAILAALALGAAGCQTTLTSVVKGSKNPPKERCEEGRVTRVENGGFTIAQECLFSDNTVVGDGLEEVTLWEFDFTGEEDHASCYPESAIIDLTLRPEGNVLGESLRVEGKWELGLEEIQSLSEGTDQETSIDMMLRNGRPSPYTSSEIQKLLNEEPKGRIPMVYEANAVVSHARLQIRCVR